MAARYLRLREEAGAERDCRVLLQDDRGPVAAQWSRFLNEIGAGAALERFDSEVLPRALRLPFLNGRSLTPGCVHFPLIWLAQRYPARHYWLVESDVDYTGSWADFFPAFEASQAHLIAAHLTCYEDSQDWYWWPRLRSPGGSPSPTTVLLKAFCPVMRVSRRALAVTHAMQRLGWRGHYEALIPTLLQINGLEVRDLRDFADCYRGTGIEPWEDLETRSTLRWRPIISPEERLRQAASQPPCLLHPVKDSSLSR